MTWPRREVPPGPPRDVAQLVERWFWEPEAVGSSPTVPTMKKINNLVTLTLEPDEVRFLLEQERVVFVCGSLELRNNLLKFIGGNTGQVTTKKGYYPTVVSTAQNAIKRVTRHLAEER